MSEPYATGMAPANRIHTDTTYIHTFARADTEVASGPLVRAQNLRSILSPIGNSYFSEVRVSSAELIGMVFQYGLIVGYLISNIHVECGLFPLGRLVLTSNVVSVLPLPHVGPADVRPAACRFIRRHVLWAAADSAEVLFQSVVSVPATCVGQHICVSRQSHKTAPSKCVFIVSL